MAGLERSSYIREALRFYFRFGSEIKVISENIKEIATKIDNASSQPTINIKEENQGEVDISESEKMLINSIQDLLSL